MTQEDNDYDYNENQEEEENYAQILGEELDGTGLHSVEINGDEIKLHFY